MLWQGSDICDILQVPHLTGAEKDDWQAGAISIDSRTLQAGDIFVALRGDNFDGHKFIGQAIDKGAAAIIGEKFDDPPKQPEHHSDIPHLQVGDSLKALQSLAGFRRQNMEAKVIGITGSVGKTSTKEMLLMALSGKGKCFASSGNFNNHIGLPLMLANCPQGLDYLILEMGMNNAGEISFLTHLARPHLAIVTNVQPAHMMNFANLHAVADAKAEIFASSPEQALFIGSAGTTSAVDTGDILQKTARQAGIKDIRTFGSATDSGDSGDSDYRLLSTEMRDGKNHISADFRGRRLTYEIGALGAHVALNSVCVLAAVDMLTGDVADTTCLRDFTAPVGRGALSQIALPGGGKAWLIDESYNASPAAVTASLKLLAAVKHGQKSPRSVAILGDMLELGEQEIDYHVALSGDLKHSRIDKLITVGERMGSLYDAVPQAVRLGAYKTRADLMKEIWNHLENDDIILLKASNSIGLGEVVRQLREGKHAV